MTKPFVRSIAVDHSPLTSERAIHYHPTSFFLQGEVRLSDTLVCDSRLPAIRVTTANGTR
jgi:hypothetical protein